MVIEQYPDRYAQIQREIAEDVSDRVSGRLGDVLVKGANVQDTLLDQLAERLESKPDIDVKDLAASTRNIAQSNHVNLQQRQLLQDKPTSISKVEGIDELVEELKREGLVPTIDLDDKDIIEE
jgi:hypothetical protein